MPFTPSHAVVGLAVVRTPLLPAAVAVGAMTPDLPLFVRGIGLSYEATHTDVILSSLLALVLLCIWYLLLRPAVRELSPTWVAGRLPAGWDAVGLRALGGVRRSVAPADRPVRRMLFPLTLAASVLLGVVSHIAWDAFTHEARWGVDLLPALAQMWGPFNGYRWLQYASSAFGLGALAIGGLFWLRRRPSRRIVRALPDAVRIVWWASLPVALIVALAIGLATDGPLSAEWTIRHLAYRVLPPACAVWAAASAVLCGVVQLARHRQSGRRYTPGM